MLRSSEQCCSQGLRRLGQEARRPARRLDPQAEQIVNSVQGQCRTGDRGNGEEPGICPIVEDAKAAYTDSAKLTALVAAIFVFFGLMASLGLPKDSVADDTSAAEDLPVAG